MSKIATSIEKFKLLESKKTSVQKPKIKSAEALRQWLIDNDFKVSGSKELYDVRGFNAQVEVDVLDDKTVRMILPGGQYRTKGVQSAANWFYEFL